MMKHVLVTATAALGLLSVHCGSDEFDAAKDCQQICSKYENCVDSDFDTSACADRCRDLSDGDADFTSKRDACESCIDTNEACAESGVQCAAECAPVIGSST
jgi:hypothetical protein